MPHIPPAARLVCLGLALLLGACGTPAATAQAGSAPAAEPTASAALPGTAGGGYTAPPMAESGFHPEAAAGETAR